MSNGNSMTIRQWGIIWGVIISMLTLSAVGYSALNAKADRKEIEMTEIRVNARITESQTSLKEQITANTAKLNKIYDITLSIASKVGVNQKSIDKESANKRGW